MKRSQTKQSTGEVIDWVFTASGERRVWMCRLNNRMNVNYSGPLLTLIKQLWFNLPKTCHFCHCCWCLWWLPCQALREGKRCVTAHWLNTVLKRKRMVPPHRTLHLPFAFPPGAKPCSQHVGPAPTDNCHFTQSLCYQPKICWCI